MPALAMASLSRFQGAVCEARAGDPVVGLVLGHSLACPGWGARHSTRGRNARPPASGGVTASALLRWRTAHLMRRGLAVQKRGSGDPETDPFALPDLEEPALEFGGRDGQVGLLDDLTVEADAALLDEAAPFPVGFGQPGLVEDDGRAAGGVWGAGRGEVWCR